MPFRWIMSALVVLGIHATEAWAGAPGPGSDGSGVGFVTLIVAAGMLLAGRYRWSPRARCQPARTLRQSRHFGRH